MAQTTKHIISGSRGSTYYIHLLSSVQYIRPNAIRTRITSNNYLVGQYLICSIFSELFDADQKTVGLLVEQVPNIEIRISPRQRDFINSMVITIVVLTI